MRTIQITVTQDLDPINPRKEYDCDGTLVFFGKEDKHLGDEQPEGGVNGRNWIEAFLYAQTEPSSVLERIDRAMEAIPSVLGPDYCWYPRPEFAKRHELLKRYRDRFVSRWVDQNLVILEVSRSGDRLWTDTFELENADEAEGFIYMDREAGRRVEDMIGALQYEIKEYRTYLEGELYEYQIEIDGEFATGCGWFESEEAALAAAKEELISGEAR